jgi:hypothetical protein
MIHIFRLHQHLYIYQFYQLAIYKRPAGAGDAVAWRVNCARAKLGPLSPSVIR